MDHDTHTLPEDITIQFLLYRMIPTAEQTFAEASNGIIRLQGSLHEVSYVENVKLGARAWGVVKGLEPD